MARRSTENSALRLQQLAQALGRVDPSAGWEELRDVLWLASHLPVDKLPLERLVATAAHPEGQRKTDARVTEALSPFDRGQVLGDARSQSTTRPVVVDDGAGGEADADADSAVYAGADGAGLGGSGSLRAIALPSPHPLPEAAELARSLRPLGRRRSRGTPRLIDEEASAEALAHTGLPQPVLRAPLERWFDAVVVVDTYLPLLAWRPRVDEFVNLLRRRAGLRDLHLFSLHALPQGMALHAPDGHVANPAAWQHGQGGRLLLVVSDATGPAWHDGRIARWLYPWACLMPVSVAQLLPEPLWSHTGLGFTDLRVQAQRRGQPTATLAVQRPDWAEGEPGLVLPILDMAPAGARRWARMLMAAGGETCPAALLPYEGASAGATAIARVPEPAAQLAALRRSARPQALKLAAALAAIKPLTLPVMRLVQASLPPAPAGHEDLAQVLASGLLTPRGPAPGDIALNLRADEHVTLDMPDSIRDELVGGLLRSEWWQLNLAVQHYIERATGNPFDFVAYLEDREGSSALAPAALPFARFARRLAERFRPPGAAGAGIGRRVVHEAVAGPGLTVRAEVALSGPVRALRWSANGKRLGVLHGLGLDIFEALRLHHGPRTRWGGWELQVLCHAADADPVRELLTSVARQLEQRTGRPVGVRVLGMKSTEVGRWKVRMLSALSFLADRDQQGGDRPVAIFAMTNSVAQPGTREHQAWWKELQRMKGASVLALSDAWSGLSKDSDLWLRVFEQGAAAPAFGAAIDRLQKGLPRPVAADMAGIVGAFAFADEAGRDWLVARKSWHRSELVLHRPSPDGDVEVIEAEALGLRRGGITKSRVNAMYVADGALEALVEGSEGISWRTDGAGAAVTTRRLRGLAQSGHWLVELRPDLQIEASYRRSQQLTAAAE